MTDAQQFADLVFEGGGVKGIGLGGAFAALEERGFTPQGVAGTSAGAIAAALVAAGYTSAELDQVLRSIPFSEFEDESFLARLPIVGHAINVLLERGIYQGRFFQEWMHDLLEAKAITKFGQLRDEGADNPKHRYRLRVIASDVTHRRMLVLPNDADHLGIDPDELDIAYAARMSMSIPIFFEPVVHRNPKTGEDHLIVDGGMLSNFPVWLFDREGQDPRWPTFGLLLVEPDPKTPIGHRLAADEHDTHPGSLLDYVKSLALTMMEAHDRLYLEKATYARTIPIPTLGVGTTEFGITDDRARALYDSGYQATLAFLADWDFPAYIEEFRRSKEHSRREDLRRLRSQRRASTA
jgi:NTE family protein